MQVSGNDTIQQSHISSCLSSIVYNYGNVLYRFQNKERFWLKIAIFTPSYA